MKNYQLNSIPLDEIKKTKNSREIDSTKFLKTNTLHSKKDLMVLKDNSKKKLKSLKTETRSCRKRIIFCNSGRSTSNSKQKLWPSRKSSCSRHLAKAKVKFRKTSREWRMLWWLTTTIKLISSRLRNASSRLKEWPTWAQLPCRIFRRFCSSSRSKSCTSYSVMRLS